MAFDTVLFDKKKLSDIFKEIYSNSKAKDSQISELILQLKPLINTQTNAQIIVPLIKEYLDLGVKNNEQLIKLAGIAQRAETIKGTEGGIGISAEELAKILESEDDQLNLPQ